MYARTVYVSTFAYQKTYTYVIHLLHWHQQETEYYHKRRCTCILNAVLDVYQIISATYIILIT